MLAAAGTRSNAEVILMRGFDLRTERDAFQAWSRRVQRRCSIAEVAGTLTTLEGDKTYVPGDAIMVGKSDKETWPVSRERFRKSYDYKPDREDSSTGLATKRTTMVWARLVQTGPVEVEGATGNLTANVGDYIVQYGVTDGVFDRAVVEGEIFESTYQRTNPDLGLAAAAAPKETAARDG